ncbi:MAG: uracil-DNA glycosylase family protein [Puniceicoccaceae bacterium]
MSSQIDAILQAGRQLAQSCDDLRFSAKVWAVYNAFDYAWPGYAAYVRRFGGGRKKTLFLGMNPGPWGMAQTGVPFGEIEAVRGWMGLEAEIGKPPREHPKRIVEGFACQRSEVSGRRLWGLFKDIHGSAEGFFTSAFVLNYCPLAFLLESGANLTPDKLSATEREPLEAACDAHLRAILEILQPQRAVGVGGWATKCLQRLKVDNLEIGTLLHPSPASPIANREWPQRPLAQLQAMGIVQ